MENHRNQERELDFLRQIITVVFSKGELEEVRNHAVWDEEREDWVIPKFEFYDIGASPPKAKTSTQKPTFEFKLDRSAAAVSPQPKATGERSNKNFKVKSRDIPSLKPPTNTKLEKLNFEANTFDEGSIL